MYSSAQLDPTMKTHLFFGYYLVMVFDRLGFFSLFTHLCHFIEMVV